MADSLKGCGGKNIKGGATCLLPAQGSTYIGGTLASVNENNTGLFKPSKAMFAGAQTEITVKENVLIPWTPPET